MSRGGRCDFSLQTYYESKRHPTSYPDYIASKFKYWVSLIETMGVESVREIKGFHDEPLKGKRSGQRSIRLNKSYRAIYVINRDGGVEIVEVQEVNKHEY